MRFSKIKIYTKNSCEQLLQAKRVQHTNSKCKDYQWKYVHVNQHTNIYFKLRATYQQISQASFQPVAHSLLTNYTYMSAYIYVFFSLLLKFDIFLLYKKTTAVWVFIILDIF